MKHGLVYLLLVAGVVLTGSLPFASHDVGELRPVQTALVRMEADRVILKTDMGDVGAGIGWDAAMADLKAKAPGTVFFGTASFLLLEESAQDLLSELPQKMELNPGCAPCFAAMGAIKREMNNAKWTWFAIGYQCLFAYAISLIIYQVGLIFTGGVQIVGLIAAIALTGLILYMLLKPHQESNRLTEKVKVA